MASHETGVPERACPAWFFVALGLICWSTAACTSETNPMGSDVPPIACETAVAPVELAALAEASGATWIDSTWGTGWLLVADRGHGGEMVLLSLDGEELVQGELPMDEGAGDDIEGLSINPTGDVVALTSDGALRAWTLMPGGPVLSRMAYPLSDDPQWLCGEDSEEEDCPDFEGICLDPAPASGPCAGFAVSKSRGKLVCLEDTSTGYVLRPDSAVTVGEPGQLSGCDYELEPPHRLLVGTNDHGDNALWEIRDPRDPSRASAHPLNVNGPERQEAIAFAPGGWLLLVGDNQEADVKEAPLAMARCQ